MSSDIHTVVMSNLTNKGYGSRASEDVAALFDHLANETERHWKNSGHAFAVVSTTMTTTPNDNAWSILATMTSQRGPKLPREGK